MRKILLFSILLLITLFGSEARAQYPTGVYAVTPDSTANGYLLSQANVKGQVIFVPWSTIDNGSGTLDWSTVETAIAPWAGAGKKTALVIWGVTADNLSVTAAPSYVLNQLPAMVSCAVNTGTGYAPNFTNPIFISAYSGFLNATIARYGSDSRIGFIRVGLGAGGEIFPPCKSQEESTYGLTQAGYQSYLETMIGNVPPGSNPVQVGVDCYGGNCNSTTIALSNNIAAYAVGARWGIGKESLQDSDITAWNSGQPCDANWCAQFAEYPTAFHDLQFAVPTCPDGNCAVGSPVTLLPFAATRDAQVVEMAQPDYCIAYGPSCSGTYTAAYDAAIAAFDAAAGSTWTPSAPTNFQVTIVPGPDAGNVTPGSLNLSFTAADTVNGNAAPLSGHEILLVRNTDTSAHNFTIYSTPDFFLRTGDVGPYSLAGGATAGFSFLGGDPVGPLGWRQPDGGMHILADDTHVQFVMLGAHL